MNLDEAIKHCEEKAKENKSKAEEFSNEASKTSSENYRLCCIEDYVKCSQCAEEHEQLAEWLKDYKRLLEERPKGEWTNISPYDIKGTCSLCCYLSNKCYNFCPNCGADMRKRGKEE